MSAPIIKLTSVQQSPSAVVAVFPFKYRNTYDFASRAPRFLMGELMKMGEPIFLSPTNISVSSQKQAITDSMALGLLDPDKSIIRKVAPEDWIFVWITDNEEDANWVIEQVKNGKPANSVTSGLKFVGRVSAVRRTTTRSGSGLRSTRVSVSAVSFGELETPVYYNPLIQKNPKFSLDFAAQYENANPPEYEFANLSDRAFSHINDLLPAAIRLFLGGANRVNLSENTADAEWNPNQPYLVPSIVGSLLGSESETKNVYTYSDLLTTLVGIQEYESTTRTTLLAQTGLSTPKLDRTKSQKNRLWTPVPLAGVFNPLVTPWSSTPLIQILDGYLNLALNERYTCLRANHEGNIVPHLVVRQKPLTTDFYAKGGKTVPHTKFSNLPRWVADESCVIMENVGKNSSFGFNYSEIRPQINGEPGMLVQSMAVSGGVSIMNDHHARRTGLRPYIQPVMASPDEITKLTSESSIANIPTITLTTTTGQSISENAQRAPISSGQGPRNVSVGSSHHQGIDIAVPEGTIVTAANKGTVSFVGKAGGFGLCVKIKHEGTETTYAHLHETLVRVGQSVDLWDPIARSGGDPSTDPENAGTSTGPHLHFEIKDDKGKILDVDMGAPPPYLATVNGEPTVVWGTNKTTTATSTSPNYLKAVHSVGNGWSALVADMVFGGHLKHTGSISLVGVQAPIPVGDNFEYDGVLYHIEQVDHSWSRNPSTGERTFQTVLGVTNGVLLDEEYLFPELEEGQTSIMNVNDAILTDEVFA